MSVQLIEIDDDDCETVELWAPDYELESFWMIQDYEEFGGQYMRINMTRRQAQQMLRALTEILSR